jgi:hypothetical protein
VADRGSNRLASHQREPRGNEAREAAAAARAAVLFTTKYSAELVLCSTNLKAPESRVVKYVPLAS